MCRLGLEALESRAEPEPWWQLMGAHGSGFTFSKPEPGAQGVCKILENYTRSFLDVIWLKKLKTEEILEIRPAVIELP